MKSNLNVPCKSIGIRVARLIVAGDFQAAREYRGAKSSWTASEARAILGASRYANKLFGTPGSTGFEMLGWQ